MASRYNRAPGPRARTCACLPPREEEQATRHQPGVHVQASMRFATRRWYTGAPARETTGIWLHVTTERQYMARARDPVCDQEKRNKRHATNLASTCRPLCVLQRGAGTRARLHVRLLVYGFTLQPSASTWRVHVTLFATKRRGTSDTPPTWRPRAGLYAFCNEALVHGRACT